MHKEAENPIRIKLREKMKDVWDKRREEAEEKRGNEERREMKGKRVREMLQAPHLARTPSRTPPKTQEGQGKKKKASRRRLRQSIRPPPTTTHGRDGSPRPPR